ncbi:OLC1v1026263C1 [Oldenlandia corymbosa var. corymbosa]|uniref:OLC1v1026263C1 n=1 Tax=Oldenlandia corymbosa var. corymbosa TaxID=529605 RepID=A0AAV1C6M6_OLDCO|nr:OLC1v1026263C1 [Oldenlandia corymbosa var. corymbosa]
MDMGILQKLSEALEILEEKKEKIQERMNVVMSECDEVENHFKLLHVLSGDCVGEIESREKDLKSAEESMVKQMCERFDLEKKSMEAGFKRLDEKEKALEMDKMECEKMKESVQEMLNDGLKKEEELQCLSDELKRIRAQVEKMGTELDSREEILRGKEDKIESKLKNLELRVKKVDEMEQDLERRQHEIHSEEKRKSSEIQLKESNLVAREKELDILENEIKSEQELLEERSFRVDSKEKLLEEREDALDAREKRFILQRCTAQFRANDLQTPGTDIKSKAKMPVDVIDLDPESDSDSIGDMASSPVDNPSFTSAEIEKTTRNINVGETWACFDAKDKMPRTYARVTKVINNGGEIRLEVVWLKPCPVLRGEEEWVDAGLPVTCGKFEKGRSSVESLNIFSHPKVCALHHPWIIYPRAGETWAVYKDWDVVEWVSDRELHRHCEYEIVEILPHSRGVSSSSGIRVAHLDKITGSMNSYKRRSNNDEDTFLIKHSCLYRFSHAVPSVKTIRNDGNGIPEITFELDLNCLPLQLP